MIRSAPTPAAGDQGCVPRDRTYVPDADLLVKSPCQQLSGSCVNQFIADVAVEPDESEILGLSDRPEEHVPAFLDCLFMTLLHCLSLPSDTLFGIPNLAAGVQAGPEGLGDRMRAALRDP